MVLSRHRYSGMQHAYCLPIDTLQAAVQHSGRGPATALQQASCPVTLASAATVSSLLGSSAPVSLSLARGVGPFTAQCIASKTSRHRHHTIILKCNYVAPQMGITITILSSRSDHCPHWLQSCRLWDAENILHILEIKHKIFNENIYIFQNVYIIYL